MHELDQNQPNSVGQPYSPDLALVLKGMGKRSFCTIATVSPANRPHAAGVVYVMVDRTLIVNTERTSRKARNIAANPQVGVVIPVPRVPIGPPSTVQFQATAEILPNDHPYVVDLLEGGILKSITSHGELENPDSCFLRITPNGKLNTFGIGMSIRKLAGDPLSTGGSVQIK